MGPLVGQTDRVVGRFNSVDGKGRVIRINEIAVWAFSAAPIGLVTGHITVRAGICL